MAKFLVMVFVVISALACASAQKYTHAQALAKIRAVGITISSSGGCSDRNVPTCTSLEQVRTNSIDTNSGGITTLKTASGCAINVTGGTEVGHASGTYSHWNGYKIDISISTCINNYITGSFKFIGNRPGDGAPQYQSAAGNIYAKEGNHWDITYY